MILLHLLLLFAPPQDPSPETRKVIEIFKQLRSGSDPERVVSFRLTEKEINSYLSYRLAHAPRPGVRASSVRILPANYFSTRTVIDFDAIEKWKPGAIPLLLRPILAGSRNISLDFRLNPKNGQAALVIEKAAFESLPIPAFLAQEIVALIAARQAERYDTSQPLPLPFGLKTVWTAEGVLMGTQ